MTLTPFDHQSDYRRGSLLIDPADHQRDMTMPHFTTIHNQYRRSNARQLRQDLSRQRQVIGFKINPLIMYPTAVALDAAFRLGKVGGLLGNRRQLAVVIC